MLFNIGNLISDRRLSKFGIEVLLVTADAVVL